MMKDLRACFPVTIFFSVEDECFVAFSQHAPGCSAMGESQEAALCEWHDALTAWLQACAAAGNPCTVQLMPGRLN